jgi:hypothetical protein
MIAPMKDWMFSVVRVSQGKPERLEIGGQQQKDDADRHQEPRTQAAEHFRHRLDLTPHGHRHPIGRLARISDRLLHAGSRTSQILAGNVRAQRQHALHVVAIVFAERRAVGDAGHIAQVDLLGRPTGDREVLHLLERVHLLLGDLDLHLIADAALGIGPVIR